jgi:phenylacetate-coenzyme A ligase PaaK-like adenylate-forming protein
MSLRCRCVFNTIPLNNFLEIENGEIIITKLTKQPLLRFNTHDLGNICSFKKAIEILKKSGYDANQLLKSEGENNIFPLPLVFVSGRNKNGLKFQGVTLTVEELQEFLSHPELIKSNTGNFKIETIKENGSERLKLTVELVDGIKPLIELSKKYQEIFCNSNFKAVLAFLKFFDGTIEEIVPIIDLVEKGQEPFSQEEKPKYHYLSKKA